MNCSCKEYKVFAKKAVEHVTGDSNIGIRVKMSCNECSKGHNEWIGISYCPFCGGKIIGMYG